MAPSYVQSKQASHEVFTVQNKNVPIGVGGRGRAVAARAKAKAGGP